MEALEQRVLLAVALSSLFKLDQQAPVRGSEETVAIASDAGRVRDDSSGTIANDMAGTTATVEMAVQLTRPDGSPVWSLAPEEEFVLHVFVKDLRQVPQGVFAGFLDVTWNGSLAAVTDAAEYGQAYGNWHHGNFSHAGWIDDAGAFSTSLSPLGAEQRELFRVHLRAVSVGTLVFTPDPADRLPYHDVLVYGSNKPVPHVSVHYRAATTTISTDHDSTNNGLPVVRGEEVVAATSVHAAAEAESSSPETALFVQGQSVDDATTVTTVSFPESRRAVDATLDGSHPSAVPFSDVQIAAGVVATEQNIAYDHIELTHVMGDGRATSTVVQVPGPTNSAVLRVTAFGGAVPTRPNAVALDESRECWIGALDKLFSELGLEPISCSRSATRRWLFSLANVTA